MKELLFRGQQEDDREWIEGGVLQILDYVAICTYSDYHGWHNFINVIPETVGQYIGELDRNRKKIFEGDIVQFGDYTGLINYYMGCYCVKTNKPYWGTRNNPAIDIILNEYPNELIVIGNIHDNPELWKGE